MASFNKIIIVGYLGRDPEFRTTPTGDAVCRFSVATTEKKGDESLTTWFRVTTWRRQAEVANQYLSKGKQVYIEGRLRTSEYTDRSGYQRTALEVTATDLQFIGGNELATRGESSARDDEPTVRPQARAASVGGETAERNAKHRDAMRAQSPVPLEDDDIPF